MAITPGIEILKRMHKAIIICWQMYYQALTLVFLPLSWLSTASYSIASNISTYYSSLVLRLAFTSDCCPTHGKGNTASGSGGGGAIVYMSPDTVTSPWMLLTRRQEGEVKAYLWQFFYTCDATHYYTLLSPLAVSCSLQFEPLAATAARTITLLTQSNLHRLYIRRQVP